MFGVRHTVVLGLGLALSLTGCAGLGQRKPPGPTTARETADTKTTSETGKATDLFLTTNRNSRLFARFNSKTATIDPAQPLKSPPDEHVAATQPAAPESPPEAEPLASEEPRHPSSKLKLEDLNGGPLLPVTVTAQVYPDDSPSPAASRSPKRGTGRAGARLSDHEPQPGPTTTPPAPRWTPRDQPVAGAEDRSLDDATRPARADAGSEVEAPPEPGLPVSPLDQSSDRPIPRPGFEPKPQPDSADNDLDPAERPFSFAAAGVQQEPAPEAILPPARPPGPPDQEESSIGLPADPGEPEPLALPKATVAPEARPLAPKARPFAPEANSSEPEASPFAPEGSPFTFEAGVAAPEAGLPARAATGMTPLAREATRPPVAPLAPAAVPPAHEPAGADLADRSGARPPQPSPFRPADLPAVEFPRTYYSEQDPGRAEPPANLEPATPTSLTGRLFHRSPDRGHSEPARPAPRRSDQKTTARSASADPAVRRTGAEGSAIRRWFSSK